MCYATILQGELVSDDLVVGIIDDALKKPSLRMMTKEQNMYLLWNWFSILIFFVLMYYVLEVMYYSSNGVNLFFNGSWCVTELDFYCVANQDRSFYVMFFC
jgi:hypothetical protein